MLTSMFDLGRSLDSRGGVSGIFGLPALLGNLNGDADRSGV
jgi:hypothetical protein